MAVLGWVLAVLATTAALLSIRNAARLQAEVDRSEAVERDSEQVRERAMALALSEEQLRRALDTIPQGVVMGDESGAVTYSNRSAADFLAARHGEALVEAAIGELLLDAAGGRSSSRTLDLYGPPRRVLAVSASPLPGPVVGGLIVVDDVSESRRLDAVRRDFVANISHELKTPVGALGLLAETLQGEDDLPVVRRMADRIVHEAFRVSRTIDDLLELSRIEGGDGLVAEEVSVERVLSEAADRVEPAAELHSVGIEVLPVPARLALRGDRRQLVSAVANLLDNAVKYSDPGSTVTVGARLGGEELSGVPSLEIVVVDRGFGIPQRDLDRVFERFYRVDQARSRNTGGTGLGLAIVRHVAANHSGEVVVRSQEGQGSTFTLRLPAGPGLVALDGTSRQGPSDELGTAVG